MIKRYSQCASNHCNQTISLVVDVIVGYSTLVEDLETIGCFLPFHEIRESSRKTHKPEIDLRSVGFLLKLASEYACCSKEEVDGNKRL